MLNIYFIRHAECEMNTVVHDYIGGRSNSSPLTGKGEEQSNILGKRLNDENLTFDRVYSSTAVRAYETARIATSHLDHAKEDIIQLEQLLELEQGDWEGKLRDEIYTPEMINKINSDNWNFKAPNGESQKEVEDRMYAFINDLKQGYEENSSKLVNIAVFTHGFSIKCLLRKINNSNPAETYKIRMDNTSITQLRYNQEWEEVRRNDYDHLTTSS
jgi:broad specificity phosphatase PhoE